MGGAREELKDLIRNEALERLDRPRRLASGVESLVYFDLRRISGTAHGLRLMASVLSDLLRERGHRYRSVGGLESGAIPLAVAMSQLSLGGPGEGVSSFYVRKRAKDHGAGRMVEGAPKSDAVIVDDVITSGGSAIAALDAAEKAGTKCACIASIVYRGGDVHRKAIEERAPLVYVFDEDELTRQR